MTATTITVTATITTKNPKGAGRKATMIHLNSEAEQIINSLNTSPYSFRKLIYPFIKNAIAGAAKRQSFGVTMKAIHNHSKDYEKDEAKAKAYGVIPRAKTVIRALRLLSAKGTITVQDIRDYLEVSKTTALQVIRIIDDIQERITDSLAFNMRFIRGETTCGHFAAPLTDLGMPDEELPY